MSHDILLDVRDIERVEEYRVEQRVVILTIVFADIVGYASLCEKLPAFTTLNIVRGVEQAVSRVLEHQHGGLIVKWMGDAALAVFSAPTAAVLGVLELHEYFAANLLDGERIQLELPRF